MPCGQAEPLLRRAVESVAGLRGFVGVDFFWEPELGEATVLEINPRATTSFVGLSRLLPAGHLAAAWLAACGVPGYESDLLEDLAEVVRRSPGLLRRRRHDPAVTDEAMSMTSLCSALAGA